MLLFAAALCFVRLHSFGIWDPWELAFADDARQVLDGGTPGGDRAPLTTWLVATGFKLFGVHEWSGRFPLTLAGLLALVVAYVLGRRFISAKAGVYTALIAATTPMFLMNSRQMLGDSATFLAQGLIALTAANALWGVASTSSDAPGATRNDRNGYLWLGGLLVAIVFGIIARGALLGVLAPLGGVAVVSLLRGEPFDKTDRRLRITSSIVTGAAVLIVLLVARAVWRDAAQYSEWVGGTPRGVTPPTFDVGIEAVFHGFAPWSALLPFAFGLLITTPVRDGSAATRTASGSPMRLVVVAWSILGYGAAVLYSSRYGPGTFGALIAVSLAVAMLLDDVEQARGAAFPVGLMAALLVALLIRDFAIYPGSPVHAIALDNVTVPPVFNPKVAWAAVLGLFAAVTVASFAIAPTREALDLRAPYRLLVTQWQRGWGTRLWIIAIGAALGALHVAGVVAASHPDDSASFATRAFHAYGWSLPWVVVFITVFVLSLQARAGASATDAAPRTSHTKRLLVGLVVFLAASWAIWLGCRLGGVVDRLHVVTIAITWLRRLALVPGALIVGVGALQLVIWVFSRSGAARFVPLALAACAVGGYTAQGFLPQLSAQFSPREIYDVYNHLSSPGEPLGEFRVGGRAAAYYARGEVKDLQDQGQLVEFLADTSRRKWAAFPTDDLAAVNRAFRARTGKHLFVADARSARVLLATNQAVEGRRNENFIAESVRDAVPPVMHHVDARFEDKIELVGYDLELPHGTYVGAGESFTIRWVFRALTNGPAGYKMFVHIDGAGNRLNGDHDPVNDRYPVRLWDRGDVVIDEQHLSVPANYRAGRYTIYMGFYAGDARLRVEQGPRDADNRVEAGVLEVR